MGQDHWHALRQDKHRLDRRSVQTDRTGTGPKPGIRLATQGIPSSWEVTVNTGTKSVPIKSAFPHYNSVATQQVEFEPVWAGMGTDADFMSRDVRGRAVIVYGFPNPGGRSDTALSNGSLQRAEAGGAAAILVVLGMPGNIINQPQAGGTTPPAKVPVFMIGNDDGNSILDMKKKQTPRIRMRLDVEPKTGLKTASVFGELPGMTDENIHVMAHTEAFFEGAMDNASGVATMLTIGEYYASIPKSQRKRTMFSSPVRLTMLHPMKMPVCVGFTTTCSRCSPRRLYSSIASIPPSLPHTSSETALCRRIW